MRNDRMEKENLKWNWALLEELVLLILEDFGRGFGVIEQLVAFLYLLPLHSLSSLNAGQYAGRCQQLQSIPEEIRATQYTSYKDIYGNILICLM